MPDNLAEMQLHTDTAAEINRLNGICIALEEQRNQSQNQYVRLRTENMNLEARCKYLEGEMEKYRTNPAFLDEPAMPDKLSEALNGAGDPVQTPLEDRS